MSSTECGLTQLLPLVPTLRRLTLANCPLKDPPVSVKCLCTISQLTNLEDLDLCEMDSEMADHLHVLSSLSKLTHFGMQLDGGGCAPAQSEFKLLHAVLTVCRFFVFLFVLVKARMFVYFHPR